MTHVEFVYWLQGFFELVNPKSLTAAQIAAIKSKLAEVFVQKCEVSRPDDRTVLSPPHDQFSIVRGESPRLC